MHPIAQVASPDDGCSQPVFNLRWPKRPESPHRLPLMLAKEQLTTRRRGRALVSGIMENRWSGRFENLSGHFGPPLKAIVEATV